MKLKVGDFIIVRKWKASTHPSPRAKEVYPTQYGDTYHYGIDKYWKVVEIIDDHTVVIETRRGKRHVIQTDQVRLRRAGFLDKMFNGKRFF